MIPTWLNIGIVIGIVIAGSMTIVALLVILGNWALDVIVRHTKVYKVWLEFAKFYKDKHKRKEME